MEAKGSSVASTRDFVMTKFGPEGFAKWLAVLSPEARKIYSSPILAMNWYPIKTGLIEPTEKICALFYNGSNRGAWEVGSHSADMGLKGVYRFFIKFGSPHFILGKASVILPTYYKPCRMSAALVDENKGSVKIHEFEDICEVVEQRVGGWIEKALEVSGRMSVAVMIVRSKLHGHEFTEYLVEWA